MSYKNVQALNLDALKRGGESFPLAAALARQVFRYPFA